MFDDVDGAAPAVGEDVVREAALELRAVRIVSTPDVSRPRGPVGTDLLRAFRYVIGHSLDRLGAIGKMDHMRNGFKVVLSSGMRHYHIYGRWTRSLKSTGRPVLLQDRAA